MTSFGSGCGLSTATPNAKVIFLALRVIDRFFVILVKKNPNQINEWGFIPIIIGMASILVKKKSPHFWEDF